MSRGAMRVNIRSNFQPEMLKHFRNMNTLILIHKTHTSIDADHKTLSEAFLCSHTCQCIFSMESSLPPGLPFWAVPQ